MTPAQTFRRLLDELDALIAAGRCNTPEADAIRDEMEGPWFAMSREEQDEARAIMPPESTTPGP